MEGLEKLEKEVLELNNSNVTAVFEYLKTRTDLYDKFENEEKSAEQMWKFICDKARKQAVHNVAMIADNLVYMWAVTYFIKSNDELGLNENKDKLPTPIDVTKKKETKKPEDNQITLFGEVKK